MACKHVILQGAQDDYRRIIEYLLDVKKSPRAALDFMNEFDRQLELACENPLLHALSRMPELASLGYRPLLVNKYVALYFYRDEQVVVAHIFHQKQDYGRIVLSRDSG